MSNATESETVTERIVGEGVNVTLHMTEPLTDTERGVLSRYLEQIAGLCTKCRTDLGGETDIHDSCTQRLPGGDCCCNRASGHQVVAEPGIGTGGRL
jgi:hypothetical protein